MINFLLNDTTINSRVHPSTTLLDFIRYDHNLRGTKIGCREGDCGACTVLIGTLIKGKVEYQSVTSCLTPIANVQGKQVVTIEGLNLNELNNVQKYMVECSGTQCGFCTPGFIVSFCGYVLNPERTISKSAKDAVDGNICRCTGYKSIERAAKKIDAHLQRIGLNSSIEDLISEKFIPEYFQLVPEKLSKMKNPPFSHRGRQPIGGGTDLYVQKPDEIPSMDLEYPQYHEKSPGLTLEGEVISLSATSSATDMMSSETLIQSIPGWYEFMKLVSSNPIRNIGTVAGNLVNASPIGDLTIMLLALGATITLENGKNKERTLSLRDFYRGYKNMDKEPDEIINRISFPIPKREKFNFEKVCKRTYLDIASVNTAIKIKTDGNSIQKADCSMGGVSPIPLYLKESSAFLSNSDLSPDTIRKAVEIMQTEISPISDARGSSDYKRLLASQLFKSHFIALFPSTIKMEDLL